MNNTIGIIATLELKDDYKVVKTKHTNIIKSFFCLLNIIFINIILLFKKCEFKKDNLPGFNINIYIAYLPFTKSMMKNVSNKRINKICKQIVLKYKEKNINYILMTDGLKNNKQVLDYIYKEENFYNFTGKELLISSIIEILKSIYKIKGSNIYQTTIAIAEKKLSKKSKQLIKLLSSKFKYIKLITYDIESAYRYIEKTYQEMGLIIRIIDGDKELKNIECLIVIDDFDELYLDKIPLIITNTNLKEKGANLIIDGIGISHKYRYNASKLLSHIKSIELTECVLFMQLKIGDKGSNINYIQLNKKFLENAYKVSSLMGMGEVIRLNKLVQM